MRNFTNGFVRVHQSFARLVPFLAVPRKFKKTLLSKNFFVRRRIPKLNNIAIMRYALCKPTFWVIFEQLFIYFKKMIEDEKMCLVFFRIFVHDHLTSSS